MSSAKKGNPMQRKRFLGALAAAFCALFSLALFAQVALAAGGNTLTVGIADESYLSDVTSKESLVADVYKVASAEYDATYDTYNYTMVGEFASLQSKLDAALNGTGDWTALCDASVEAAKSSTPAVQGHVIAGSGAGSISLADDGIYLTNVVSALSGSHSQLIRDVCAALRTQFENVLVLPMAPDEPHAIDNNVVIASDGPLSAEGATPLSPTPRGRALTDVQVL